MIENSKDQQNHILINKLMEAQYPYFIKATSDLKLTCLSQTDLWSCQSLEFGKKMGLALKKLHQIPIDNETLRAQKTISLIPQRSFSDKLIQCQGLWKKYEAEYESCGFPIKILEEVFMGYEELVVEDEQILLHANLSSEQIFVDDNRQFLGFKDWGHLQIGNRGLDLAVAWMIFEEPVAKSFFTAYGSVEETQFELSLFQSLYLPLIMLPNCFKMKDEILKQWTVFALRKAIGL